MGRLKSKVGAHRTHVVIIAPVRCQPVPVVAGLPPLQHRLTHAVQTWCDHSSQSAGGAFTICAYSLRRPLVEHAAASGSCPVLECFSQRHVSLSASQRHGVPAQETPHHAAGGCMRHLGVHPHPLHGAQTDRHQHGSAFQIPTPGGGGGGGCAGGKSPAPVAPLGLAGSGVLATNLRLRAGHSLLLQRIIFWGPSFRWAIFLALQVCQDIWLSEEEVILAGPTIGLHPDSGMRVWQAPSRGGAARHGSGGQRGPATPAPGYTADLEEVFGSGLQAGSSSTARARLVNTLATVWRSLHPAALTTSCEICVMRCRSWHPGAGTRQPVWRLRVQIEACDGSMLDDLSAAAPRPQIHCTAWDQSCNPLCWKHLIDLLETLSEFLPGIGFTEMRLRISDSSVI